MPTYGYRCTTCAHEFERVQKMSDAPVTICEDCGGPVKKILYPVGISFKGSGFYVNDSKSSGGGGSKSESNGESGGGESKKEPTGSETPAAATDSKPAARTEAKPAAAAEPKPASAADKL